MNSNLASTSQRIKRISERFFHRYVRSCTGVLVAILATGCGSSLREMASNTLQVGDAEMKARTDLTDAQQAEIYFTLGRNAEMQNNLQEAGRMYRSVLAKSPEAGEAHWRLAVCLDKSGNFDKSEHHYTLAIKFMPGNPQIFTDYGYSLSLQSRWREAEMQLRQAIASKPDLSRAHNNLGIVLAQGSNLEEATREFRLGGANMEDAHWNVGQTLVAQSRWEEARGEFRRILASNPGDPQVAAQLESLERLVVKMERVRNDRGPVTDVQMMRASATSPAAIR